MAIKYLAGERIIGTAAERTAMTTGVLSPIDFDVLSNWVQDPVGTVTWSSGSPNYARNSTRITSSNWEFTYDPSASNWGTGMIGRAGVSLTTTPTDPEYFNFDWLTYDGGSGDQIWYHRSEPDGSNTVQTNSGTYTSGAIYSIKCVDNVVSFLKDGVNVYTVPEAYNFDSSVNTSAYFSISTTPNGLADMVGVCESRTSLTPSYPNLPNGVIFEESDTGKIYMWDGTSAWNEVF